MRNSILLCGLVFSAACSNSGRNECLDVAPGTTPAGYALSGTVQVKEPKGDGRTIDVDIDTKLYFPKGRVAGAPVFLDTSEAKTVTPALGFGSLRGGFRNSSLQQVTFTVEQNDPSSELKAHVTINLAEPSSDIVRPASGDGTLCITEVLDETPKLSMDIPVLFPTKYLRWSASGPIDTSSLSNDTVLLANGQPVPGTFTFDGDELLFTAEGRTPPNAELELRPGSLKSILGKPVSAAPLPKPLVTTSELTDLTFSEEPPVGAAASWRDESFGVANGELHIGIADSYSTRNRSYYSLVSLGNPGAATTATLRARVRCQISETSTWASLVTSAGAASDFRVDCASDFTDVTVPVPGAGPLWLLVVNGSPGSQPQSAPAAPGDMLIIDEISFE